MSFVKPRQNHLCTRWPPPAGPSDDAAPHDISPTDRLNELRPQSDQNWPELRAAIKKVIT